MCFPSDLAVYERPFVVVGDLAEEWPFGMAGAKVTAAVGTSTDESSKGANVWEVQVLARCGDHMEREAAYDCTLTRDVCS